MRSARRSRRPVLGGSFGFALLALLGFPPFGIFASELAIARAGFAADMGWVTAAALLMVLVVVAAILVHLRSMLLGAPGEQAPASERPRAGGAAYGAGLALLTVVGVTIWPIQSLIEAAARVVSS